MKQTIILTGDANLLNVTDPTAPFARVADTLRQADVVFGNLECCLYEPGEERDAYEGFYVGTAVGEALKLAGYHVVGCANNVNYGAEAIRASLARLNELGILHTGAGINRQAARAPAILKKNGIRFGFLQYTSVFWPIGHEAGERSTGVATIKAHTAYQPRLDWNRAGIPPTVITWTEPSHLKAFEEDIASLRQQVDLVISSHHWGYAEEVLQYQVEVGHAAIQAGADMVVGHGPHFPLAIEVYKDKPIFYGLGSFSFHTGHLQRMHGDWVGLMVKITLEDREVVKVTCSPVRHNERNETVIRSVGEELEAMKHIASLSEKFGTKLDLGGNEVVVWQKG